MRSLDKKPIQDIESFQWQKCPSGDNARLWSLEKKQNEDSEAEEQLPVELIQDGESFQEQKCPSGDNARLRSLDTVSYTHLTLPTKRIV